MTLDHLGELIVRLKSLPLQARTPVLEELPRPGLTGVIPQLTEAFLEQVSGVEALVGGEQGLERSFALQREVRAMGQQGVFLTLDVVSILAGEPVIFGLTNLVERAAALVRTSPGLIV
jgi:hypothetical protein